MTSHIPLSYLPLCGFPAKHKASNSQEVQPEMGGVALRIMRSRDCDLFW